MTLVRPTVSNPKTSIPGNWSNGVGWVAGCTMAAGGNTVEIDSPIPGGDGPVVNAGSLVIGAFYRITVTGSTAWTSIGAASGNVGTEFQATGDGGAGTGGQAVPISTITTLAAGAAVAGGTFNLAANVTFNAHVRAGSTTCLNISGANSYTISNTRIAGGSIASAFGINFTGSGVLLVSVGSSILAGTGAGAHGINANGTGTVRADNAIDIRGGSGSSFTYGINHVKGNLDVQNNSVVNGGNSTSCSGITSASGTTINFNNSTANSGNGNAASGITAAGNITGTGNIFNAGTFEGLVVTGNGMINLTGSNQYNSSAANFAVSATSATVTHPCVSGTANNRISAGVTHEALNVRRYNRPATSQQDIHNAPDNTTTNMYTPDAGVIGQPSPSVVLAGTVYGPSGSLTGTLVQTVSPSLTQIATAVWSTASDRTLSTAGVNAIKSGLSTLSAVDVRTSVWVDADSRSLTDRTEFSLSTSGVQAISDRIERSGGPLATVAAFLAQLNASRLMAAATDETVASIVAALMSGM